MPDGWDGAGIYAIAYHRIYDDNGGTGSKSAIVPNGSTISLDDDGVSNPGYTFSKWNAESDGDIVSIEPVLTEDDGSFSGIFIMPDIGAETLALTAGSGRY